MKNSYKNIVYSYGSGLIKTIFEVITVPVALNYFGKNTYGLFAIIADTIAYLALFNFGIPWATATIFAKLSSYDKQKELLKKAIWILLILCAIGILSVILFNLIFPNWINFITEINSNTKIYVKPFIIISVLLFFGRLPFTLFSQLLIFINKAYIAKIIDIFSIIFSFISLLTVIYLKLSIVDFAIINGVVLFLPLIGCVFVFFKIWKTQSITNQTLNYEDSIAHKYLISSSFYFFINSIGGLILWNTDNFVISHYLGLNYVAQYAILFKVYTILFAVIAQLMNVINPLFPKLFKESKIFLLADIYHLMLKIFPIIGGVIAIIIFGLYKELVFLWTNNDSVFIGYLSCFFMGIFCYFSCSSIVPYFLMVSLNYAKHIYKLTLLEAMINLVLSIVLVQIMGVSGVIFATLIAHVFSMFLLVPKKIDNLFPQMFKFNYNYIFKHALFVLIPTIITVSFINRYENWHVKILLLLVMLFYLIASFIIFGKNDFKKCLRLIKNHS